MSFLDIFRRPSIEREIAATLGPVLGSIGLRVIEVKNEVQWASMVLTDGQIALRVERERWQYWLEVGQGVEGPWWNFNQLVVGFGGEKRRWPSEEELPDPTTLPYLAGQFSKHHELVLSRLRTMSESDVNECMTQLGFNSYP